MSSDEACAASNGLSLPDPSPKTPMKGEVQMTLPILPPDVSYPRDGHHQFRPSWSGATGFLNEEHAAIWDQTKAIPGWQHEGDSAKLYEMAYHNGAVILEIGNFGGRSAVVELRAALRAMRERGAPEPQFYGIDLDPAAVRRTYNTLRSAGLDQYALLYHGTLARFHPDIPITPTMVFVDGDHCYEGVWADLQTLSTFLAPGTPVFCHDYIGIEGVTRAIDEWADSGFFDFMGSSGCGALLRATARCPGVARGLRPETFSRLQNALLARYLNPDGQGMRLEAPTPVRDLTALARCDLGLWSPRQGISGRGAWPYAAPEGASLPATLPGGRPWPKISIVTPTYNQGRYIEETILSIANQNYPNVEHIVIDGGSTDETPEILERHRGKLAHVVSEKDRGQSHAINKGFRRATGDIVTWLNSDDQLAPGALAAVALAFHTSGADMVAGVCQLSRDSFLEGQHLTSCANGPLPLHDLLDLDNCWNVGQFFYQPEVFFTRKLWDRAGGHVQESAYYSMDYEMWLRFADAGAQLHVIGRPLAIFRVHPEQKTAVPERFQKELVTVRDEFLRRTGRPPFVGKTVGPRKHKLRIAFLNDAGFRFGAGIAHERLARAVARAGHDVSVLSLGNAGELRVADNEAILQKLEERSPDLVVLGNLHGAAVDPSLTGRIASRWPTTVVLHDFWPLTGRCAYPGDCTRFVQGCDDTCPTAGEYPVLAPEKIAEAFRIKHQVFGLPRPPALLAVTAWAEDEARRLYQRTPTVPALSAGGPKIGRIGLGLALDVFRPRDRSVCRELLGLPRDAFIVVTSACSIKETRKGMHHLVRALEQLDLPDVLVLLVGSLAPEDVPPLPNVRVLGFVPEPQKLALAYGAADVYVGPSLAETFGQVFMEAAACGTPSIGYAVGGVKEALPDGVTGRLVPDTDPAALAGALEELYTQPQNRRDLGRWARLYAENEWSFAAVFHRFHTALAQLGFRDELELTRKISFAATEVPLVGPELVEAPLESWAPATGFGKWEGPYPQWGLPVCIWSVGPRSVLELTAEKEGRHTVVIRCLTYEAGQYLRIAHEGRVVLERAIPATASNRAVTTLVLDLDLKAGKNSLELCPWCWARGSTDEEQRAILLLGVDVCPVGTPGVPVPTPVPAETPATRQAA